MIRSLYQWLMRLHPRQFRERFGGEMLCIFDEAEARARTPLLADGAISVLRQWVLRSGAWKGVAALLGALLQIALAVLAWLGATRRMPVPWPAPGGGTTESSRSADMLLLLISGVVTAIILSATLAAVWISSFGLRRLGRTAARKRI